jgi:uncharacterized protein (TIGR00251 family)
MRTLRVKVKPNARASALEACADGTWLARLKAPPVDGKANAALIEFLADELDVSRSSLAITVGETSRQKTIRIRGLDAATIQSRLLPAP